MTEEDKKILIFIRDRNDGSVSRERLLKAFKRGGGAIGHHEGRPTIFFGTDFIPIGSGEICMSTPHENYLNRISMLARNVLKYDEIRTKFHLTERPHKRKASPVNFPFPTQPTSP